MNIYEIPIRRHLNYEVLIDIGELFVEYFTK
mgnify:CR=1 FL=1